MSVFMRITWLRSEVSNQVTTSCAGKSISSRGSAESSFQGLSDVQWFLITVLLGSVFNSPVQPLPCQGHRASQNVIRAGVLTRERFTTALCNISDNSPAASKGRAMGIIPEKDDSRSSKHKRKKK